MECERSFEERIEVVSGLNDDKAKEQMRNSPLRDNLLPKTPKTRFEKQ